MSKSIDLLRKLKNFGFDHDKISMIQVHDLLMQCKLVYKWQRKDWLVYLISNEYLMRDETNDQIFILNKQKILSELDANAL